MKYNIIMGDCLEELKKMDDNSIDSVVTDPPAGISFLGNSWDTFDKNMFGIKGLEGDNDLKNKKNFKILPRYSNSDLIGFQTFIYNTFKHIYRILKPGGHCLVWSIPRTSHHTGMGLERAGFEVRDCIYHAFSQGFPKNMDISKQIDKKHENNSNTISDESIYWDGWGTALKPGIDVWWLIRKPISENTITENVLKWGTGAINIDGCRIPRKDVEKYTQRQPRGGTWSIDKCGFDSTKNTIASVDSKGGYPINFINDGSDDVLELFPDTNSKEHWSKSKIVGYGKKFKGNSEYEGVGRKEIPTSKSSSRFFYIKKQGLKILSGSGTDSDIKQKRSKALPLGESMTSEAHPISYAVGG